MTRRYKSKAEHHFKQQLKMPLPPYLPTTTLLFLTTFILLSSRIKRHGPFKHAPRTMKYNSLLYSLFSLILCLSILSTFPLHPLPSICTSPSPRPSEFEEKLGLIFHYSKIYEYVDIFNVIAAGGVVNVHFRVHHFTVLHPSFSPFLPPSPSHFKQTYSYIIQTPYLTYARVLQHPTGWKIFGALNTFHHALMYAYFGGFAWLGGVLPWTGYVQLFAGVIGEVVVIRDVKTGGRDCGGTEGLWATYLGLGIYCTYAVLFLGDVWKKGEKGKKE